ncbi:PspC domain-containing protein [bacterium]|nr:PspC domain-containing protein [bacterium]
MDNQPRKLYRSISQRQLGGVCGGLGEYLNVDPTIMRLIFVAGFFLTGSLTFWAYLIMWIVVPESTL